MSEMINVSVSHCNDARFIAMQSKKVIENVSFGTFRFYEDYWDGCKFVNCVFDTMKSMRSIYCNFEERKNLVFENCIFRDSGEFMKGHLTDCKFIGCKFDNGWIYTSFFSCEFNGCKFDHSHLFRNRFEKCSFKRCETEFCDINGVKCVKCVGKKFVRILSPMACPEKGEYEAWKKCYLINSGNRVYAKLLIPADAQRSSAHGSNCRASKAKVLGFYDRRGKRISVQMACSWWDKKFIYKVGETVTPTKPYNRYRYDECTSGIHHFMTLAEAVSWRP